MDEKFQTPLQKELLSRLSNARAIKRARAKPEERERTELSDSEHFKRVMEDSGAWTGHRLI